MNTIKFSHKYCKMPALFYETQTELLQLFVCDYKDLSREFIGYDTIYEKENGDFEEYELPKTKLIVLLLSTGHQGQLWTTIRRHTPEKERYYRSIIGETVQIEIKKEGNK